MAKSKEEILKAAYEHHKTNVIPDQNWASWDESVEDGTCNMVYDAMEEYAVAECTELTKENERLKGLIVKAYFNAANTAYAAASLGADYDIDTRLQQFQQQNNL